MPKINILVTVCHPVIFLFNFRFISSFHTSDSYRTVGIPVTFGMFMHVKVGNGVIGILPKPTIIFSGWCLEWVLIINQ